MGHKVFAIPNYSGTAVDLVLCNVADANGGGLLHYAYTVGAEEDSIAKRTIPWAQMQEFREAYGRKYPNVVQRLKNAVAYWPGEEVLDSEDGPTFATDHDTLMRLGALELLANLSSGRLSTTDKDPFPHQLALQQYFRKQPRHEGTRRVLIADEVGLGKTIEVGLILRDMLLARGRLDQLRCLYLTSGGLIDDAAEKLRDVLSGIVDGDHIVETVPCFRKYGTGNIFGVHVASMHAARLYTLPHQKQHLPPGLRPDIIIIDECHHAASEGNLAGAELRSDVTTQTYVAAKQFLAGEFWLDSECPQLAILMSATPFRSGPQFLNLLRLLTNGVLGADGHPFNAFDSRSQAHDLRGMLQDDRTAASVVWRRQSDESVRSWAGNRIFPNVTVIRPHQAVEGDLATPRLPQPSDRFLKLLARIKTSVAAIARAHGQSFGGFAIAQLEKKLTSSSIAGACWLFSWAIRHSQWDTQDDYKNDKSQGAEGLRRLIRSISQRLAQFNPQSSTGHATVRFPSDGFEFPAISLAQLGVLVDIQRYSKLVREEIQESSKWVAHDAEICQLVDLAESLLDLGRSHDDNRGGAEDAKLAWLNELLRLHPDDRLLLFTESLQTCEILQSALGSACRILVGSMSKASRNQAVADLRNPKMNARVLIATSAADEGFDLQVAKKVVHWDLSSSPATLMQRNGRVARLGQVSDVIAYYLILTGTHEERRDSALQAKFAYLGIDDEVLKSRILGSLSVEEEERLEQAIEDNEEGVVGDILKKAASDNEKMDRDLAEIRTNLQFAHVLSREDLADRLQAWQSLGLPDAATGGVTFQFDSIHWERPVFADVSRLEPTESKVAHVQNPEGRQHLVFDPEFLVFGPRDEGNELTLAGLPPWIKTVDPYGKHCIVPFTKTDLLGRLFQGIARLRRADFLTIPRSCVNERYRDATWLLFCTHPIREVENTLPPKLRAPLTFYAFSRLVDGEAPVPLCAEGADAGEVHELLLGAEQLAIQEELSGLDDDAEIEMARTAGLMLQNWAESVTRFGAASFLEEEKYFAPIPVALVRIVD